MSKAALRQERFETIEAYLLGTMGNAERIAFEQELASDEDLRAEVDAQRENTLAVELGAFTRTLGSVVEVEGRKEEDGWMRGSSWAPYLKYAAAVALIMSAALWIIGRPSANERLFAEHYVADPGLPVPMSATDDHVFQDAMVAYKLGDYAEARAKWAGLAQERPESDTLRFYIACAALGEGDATAAVPLLKGVGDDGRSVFARKARWFLFLAYVEQDAVTEALAVPLDDDATYGERVRAIKAELR